ncbi:MAG: hypothetical protein J2P48_20515, partial [Alphaproteobacteria bacterium]|nr:hypothetical protein [Alphaproteobacteria bacterium]
PPRARDGRRPANLEARIGDLTARGEVCGGLAPGVADVADNGDDSGDRSCRRRGTGFGRNGLSASYLLLASEPRRLQAHRLHRVRVCFCPT